jgi:hypothetical protein
LPHYDVVVLGGGLAGVSAAIQAARLGARVALVEREQVLGGLSSALFGIHILGATEHGNRPWAQETGLVEELELEALHEGAFFEPAPGVIPYFNSRWSDLLRRKCEEAGVHLYLKSLALSAERTGFKVSEVTIAQGSRHELRRLTIEHALVDATGDGDIAASLGCSFRYGREGREEFKECFAPEQPDLNVAGASLIYWLVNTGKPVEFTPPPGTPVYKDASDVIYGAPPVVRDGRSVVISWATEWGGHLDTLRDEDIIYRKLLEQIYATVDWVKNRSPYAEAMANYQLAWISPLLGKRESRRFIGDYTLTQHDLYPQERLFDRVAYGGFPIDQHEAAADPERPRIVYYDWPDLYDIPLRALYSKDLDNVLFAGRNISGTHVAHGSYRVMKTCGAMGQAVGACAAFCAAYGTTPRGVARMYLDELQQTLLREDATILGLTNDDPLDLARKATVSASSESPDLPAAAVTDGHNRQLADAPAHKWVAEGLFPQYVTLHFKRPTKIGAAQLTFDTNLNSYRGAQFAPRAIPETPKHYRVWLATGGQGEVVAEEEANYQRVRRHEFEPREAEQLVLEVIETNGSTHAGVYELRAYERWPQLAFEGR